MACFFCVCGAGAGDGSVPSVRRTPRGLCGARWRRQRRVRAQRAPRCAQTAQRQQQFAEVLAPPLASSSARNLLQSPRMARLRTRMCSICLLLTSKCVCRHFAYAPSSSRRRWLVSPSREKGRHPLPESSTEHVHDTSGPLLFHYGLSCSAAPLRRGRSPTSPLTRRHRRAIDAEATLAHTA